MAEVAEYEWRSGGALRGGGGGGGGGEVVGWWEFDDAYTKLVGATFKTDGNHCERVTVGETPQEDA